MSSADDPDLESGVGELGGDAACWAHLFDETRIAQTVVDLVESASAPGAHGPVWNLESDDLHVNLLVFAAGEGVGRHRNPEVDVLIVGVAGEGEIEIDGALSRLTAGSTLLVPKGSERRITAASPTFSYLSAHRRRGLLVPTISPSRQ
jgi:quercetin dioxygenase-like cupin family protein